MALILGRRSGRPTRSIGFQSRLQAGVADELVSYAGDGHLITFAPTGTGKTSGPVICNALTHPGQLIVMDIKGEVHAATAKARKALGQEVHVLDLRDGGLAGSLNPLDLAVRTADDPAVAARTFAAEMIERGTSHSERFWDDWAETMLTGAIAWVLTDLPPPARKLSRVFDLYTEDDVTMHLAKRLDKKEVTNKSALAAFTSFLQLPSENTRPSVLASTQAHLRLLDNKLIRRVTGSTSFDLDAFIAGEPISLYIIIPPHRLTAFAPVLRLWLSGLMLSLTLRTERPEHRTLMLCDEIASLGRIDAFLTASTLLRSWGLTLWSFWQNPSQLQIYEGQANTIVDNAGVVQCFGARNRRMAQEFVNLVGGTVDEVMKMAPDEQLLLIEGGTPTLCKQVRYYERETTSVR